MMNRPNTPSDQSSQAASGGQMPRGMRATPPTPSAPRRVTDMVASASSSRRTESGPRYGQGDGRRMVVARDITLAGQISKCDYLIVEGSVESMRYDGQTLEVTESGSFNGQIEVDSADIGGMFDGSMIVRGRLTVRPTGRVTGNISYGELEVNAGGQMNGELKAIQNSMVRRPETSDEELDDVVIGAEPAKDGTDS